MSGGNYTSGDKGPVNSFRRDKEIYKEEISKITDRGAKCGIAGEMALGKYALNTLNRIGSGHGTGIGELSFSGSEMLVDDWGEWLLDVNDYLQNNSRFITADGRKVWYNRLSKKLSFFSPNGTEVINQDQALEMWFRIINSDFVRLIVEEYLFKKGYSKSYGAMHLISAVTFAMGSLKIEMDAKGFSDPIDCILQSDQFDILDGDGYDAKVDAGIEVALVSFYREKIAKRKDVEEKLLASAMDMIKMKKESEQKIERMRSGSDWQDEAELELILDGSRASILDVPKDEKDKMVAEQMKKTRYEITKLRQARRKFIAGAVKEELEKLDMKCDHVLDSANRYENKRKVNFIDEIFFEKN